MQEENLNIHATIPPLGDGGVVALYAEIIIPSALPKNYTWSVPPHLVEIAKVPALRRFGIGEPHDGGTIKGLAENRAVFAKYGVATF